MKNVAKELVRAMELTDKWYETGQITDLEEAQVLLEKIEDELIKRKKKRDTFKDTGSGLVWLRNLRPKQ